MNTAELRVHIDAYLNLRGSLGLQTEITGYYLRELSNYVEAQGFSWPIRTQTILEWISAASPHCGLSAQRTRLTQARCFLKHLISRIVLGLLSHAFCGLTEPNGSVMPSPSGRMR